MTAPVDLVADLVDALYAEWLMAQPEAGVCNGDILIQRLEEQWGFDAFMRQLPKQFDAEVRRHLKESA